MCVCVCVCVCIYNIYIIYIYIYTHIYIHTHRCSTTYNYFEDEKWGFCDMDVCRRSVHELWRGSLPRVNMVMAGMDAPPHMTHVSSSSYCTRTLAREPTAYQRCDGGYVCSSSYPPPHMTHVSSSSYDACILLLI